MSTAAAPPALAPLSLTGIGEGPGVVLLHGSADTPQAWGRATALLSGEFTVYTPPLPPLADRPGSAQPQLALEHDLPWLSDVLASTGARLLAAHSYGALLALRWALAHPGHLHGLVLAEPIAWGLIREECAADPAFLALGRCVGLFSQGEHAAAMEWLINYWNGEGFWQRLPDRVRAQLLAGARRTAAEVQSGDADRTHPGELAGLHLNTQVLVGTRTTAQSLKVQHHLASAIPRAVLIEAPGGGHQFLRTHPELVANAVRAAAGGG